MNEVITKERLKRFHDAREYLSERLQAKQELMSKLNIKGIDYSKSRVTAGNGNRTTEQERYVIALERINKEITKLDGEISAEIEIISKQINRISKPVFRKVIFLKYIEFWKTWEVIEDLNLGNPNFNPDLDIEEFKKTSEYEYFRNEYYKLEDRAIKELERVTGKAFVPTQNQLRLL